MKRLGISRSRSAAVAAFGLLATVASACYGGNGSDFPNTIYIKTEQFQIIGPGVTGQGYWAECQYSTYVAANTSNSNFKLWANDGCDFGTATPQEANALTNGTQCRFQVITTFQGNNESWGIASPNWDAFDPCYQTNVPARTLACPTSGCHGTWSGTSYYDLLLPSGYSVQLQGDQSEYCQDFASDLTQPTNNEMDCIFPYNATI